MSFNTVEDVNGTQFDNQGFWWHEIDTSLISETEDFTDIKVDFCRVSRSSANTRIYTIKVDNSYWAKGFSTSDKNGNYAPPISTSISGNTITVKVDWSYASLKIGLYMGIKNDVKIGHMRYFLKDDVLNLNYKELNTTQDIEFTDGSIVSTDLSVGVNHILYGAKEGYVLVNLIKTDFQFSCNQQLVVGEVNTVQLGTHSDYKVGGDLVGEYTTKLSVLYNGKTIPVVWNSQLNDYTFDLDLTNVTEEKKIRFKVIVETNDVLNASETDVALDCKFETINTLAKLTELFRSGGVGRLGANLTLTNDLTVSKSVNLIGNEYSIDMASHKLVVPSDLTLKVNSVNFSNGENSIQQEPNSNVELTYCSFTDCTGFGSVIDCQVDLANLDETDDFNTKLTNCTFSNCDMAILSGGNLEVDGCTVTGKISNKNYPYFLYQTDGNATILNSQFNLSSDTVYDYDLEFNTCIFTCGETATINGYSHSELQQNNMSAFFNTQRNTSTIDVKYYYSLIEDTVHLQSSKGFCHSVSGVDFVYKTNITLTRGE